MLSRYAQRHVCHNEHASHTQAAVVRVMKSRREVPHTDLLTAVVSQLKDTFTPIQQDIKKNIENLIEKDYIERTPDGKAYIYLA